jgi:hypothetical protein
MIRELMSLILIILLLNGISAIKINEVEMNPKDECNDCTEWAELYSEEEVNLSEYTLENNKSSIINLTGLKKGYISIDFGKRFLTNTGDKLILKKNEQIIDETLILKDEDNNDLTWQLCNGSWKFVNSTKGQENNCKEEIKENNTIVNDTSNEEPINNPTTETESRSSSNSTSVTSNTVKNIPKSKTETINLTPISLNAQNIKSENNKEVLNKNLALSGIITFGIMFGGLFLLKQARRKKENEFR